MTALYHHRNETAPAPPSLRRLLAGAIVGGAGAISFSLAVGSFVVGSNHRLEPATAAEAASLVASAPSFVLVGFVHLAVAVALIRGRSRFRDAATIVTVIAAILAIGSAVMLLAGIDPAGGPRAGHPTTQGVAVLLLAAAGYAIAALVARPTEAEA